jgi:hypothetical protein
MTWLTVTEYLSHKWPLICYHRLFNKNNTTGNTCEAGTADPSGAHEFTPVCSGVRVARYLVFCVKFCRSLFVLVFFFSWPMFVCPSSNYGFWLPLWYFQTFLKIPRLRWIFLLDFGFPASALWFTCWQQLWFSNILTISVSVEIHHAH